MIPGAHTDDLFLFEQMTRIRRMEEKAAELYSATKIRGFLHLYVGEEAIAAGAITGIDPEAHQDAIVSTYREHGHALMRGIPMKRIMAEMFGKVEGCSRGRGGSMHLFDTSLRFYGGNAIVGGGIPLAVGIAMADKRLKKKSITVCFFGDGAVAEGEFHESLNLASLWKLPVLFLCENNQYCMGTALERAQAETNLAVKARSYRIHSRQVDGMDVQAVRDATARAAAEVRDLGTPVFLEFLTYRFRSHSMYDPDLYRSKAEIEEWKKRDPILLLSQALRQAGLLDDAFERAVEERVARELAEAIEFAENAPWEPVEDLLKHVYAERSEVTEYGDAVGQA